VVIQVGQHGLTFDKSLVCPSAWCLCAERGSTGVIVRTAGQAIQHWESWRMFGSLCSFCSSGVQMSLDWGLGVLRVMLGRCEMLCYCSFCVFNRSAVFVAAAAAAAVLCCCHNRML
jgi:hypothetical protein